MPIVRKTFCLAATVIFVGVVYSPQPSEAIYRRPDRSDKQYQELGNPFAAVCDLVEYGSGTLIAPRWVLTHNHFVPDHVPKPGDKIQFDDRSITIKNVYRHPNKHDSPVQVDITLLELSSPVTGIEPIRLYVWSDELQKECKLVGYGWPGEIMQGRTNRHASDTYVAVRRAGTNRISRVSDENLHTAIDLSEEATDLEAAVSAGDSGGALLIERNGQLYLAGVNSGFRLGGDEDILRRKDSEDDFARVSAFAPWIEKTTGHDFGARTWQKWTLRIGSVVLILGAVRYIQSRRKRANLLDSEQK